MSIPLLAALINATLLFSIAGLHVYWAFGGKGGLRYAVPGQYNTDKSVPVFQPGAFPTAVVAIGLAGMALCCLEGAQLIHWGAPASLVRYALWGISGIFLLRAIGDFKYVGLFKRIKGTPFARYDSRYYIILCLLLSGNCGLIAFALD